MEGREECYFGAVVEKGLRAKREVNAKGKVGMSTQED